jgi:hypothetical protein
MRIRTCLRHAVAVASLLAAVSTPATSAFAQAKPSPARTVREELPEAMRGDWEQGLTLSKEGKFELARVKFMQVYDQSKNPRVLFNAGVMEKNLGRFAAAIELWERELTEGKGRISADEESQIKENIAGLKKWVMNISLDVSETNAEVFVDGEKIGVTPLPKPISVAIGTHNIRVTKAGFSDAHAHVDGKDPSPKVNLKLDPLQRVAQLIVSIEGPPQATIKVDSREVGTATKDQPYKGPVSVSAEPHTIEAEAPGWVPGKYVLKVEDTNDKPVPMVMSSDQRKGKLLVVAKPEGATIEIDGKTVGASRWEGPVDTGNHQVVVKKQGFYTWSYDVDVPKGGERSVTAQLNEDRNTSYVPWLIGTVLVVGGGAVAAYFIAKPKDEEPVRGSLAPFALGTTGLKF